MKKIFYLFIGVLIVLFSSCSKCVECEGEYMNDGTAVGGPYLEVCRDNFQNNSQYQWYVDSLESYYGYDCKSDLFN